MTTNFHSTAVQNLTSGLGLVDGANGTAALISSRYASVRERGREDERERERENERLGERR